MKVTSKNKMHPMTISKDALGKYKLMVKGNGDISDDLAARKITRNWLLGTRAKSDDKRFEVRDYGFLTITQDKSTKAIVDINNKAYIVTNNNVAYIDEKKKAMLNFRLGIGKR